MVSVMDAPTPRFDPFTAPWAALCGDDPMDDERLSYRQQLAQNREESNDPEYPCPQCDEWSGCTCAVRCQNCGQLVLRQDAVEVSEEIDRGVYGVTLQCGDCS